MTPLTYVYCVIRSRRRPSMPPGIDTAGMPGGRDTRAVAAGADLWLIVTTVPQADYGEAALDAGLQDLDWVAPRALAHETVVEQFLSAPAVLPMQLFTLFTSDERALAHVARQRREILRIVGRLERRHEWGVRLTFDEQGARSRLERQHARRKRAVRSSGAAYLAHKRDLLDISRLQLAAAKTAADQLFTALAHEADDARRRTATEQASAGSRLLLDAAFLVPTTRTRSFRASVARRAREAGASGLVVSLTGPWPPYNFIAAPRRQARGKAAR